MIEQLDYIYFLNGFGFIVLSAVCFMSDSKSLQAYKWLGFFSLTQCLVKWLDILPFSFGESLLFKDFRMIIVIISFICLIEFGRLSYRTYTGKGPGFWIIPVLFVFGCSGSLYESFGLNIIVRFAFCFIGAVWTAIAMFSASHNPVYQNHKQPIHRLGILLVIFALIGGIDISRLYLLPLSSNYNNISLMLFGIFIQLFQIIFSIVFINNLWQMLDLHEKTTSYRIIFISSLFAILSGGWFFTNIAGGIEYHDYVTRLQSTCAISAASINSKNIDQIYSMKDIEKPAYKQLKERLMIMHQVTPDLRFIYLLVMKDGKIIFSADSESPASSDYSSPGDIYSDAPDELYALFQGNVDKTTIKYEDKWGKWISAFVPVKISYTGKPIAILGMDYPQSLVSHSVYFHRFELIAITLLIALLAILLFFYHVKRELFIQNISERNDLLFEKEKYLSCTLHSIGDAVIATDCYGCITRMNPVAEFLTGWNAAKAAKKPIEEILHIVNASTRELAFNPVTQVLATGETADLANNTIIISKDGIERQIADSCSPIRDNRDNVIGAVLVFRDVTDEYCQRNALRESEEKYRSLINNANEAIVVAQEGMLKFINPMVLELLEGYQEHEILGRPFADFIYEDDKSKVVEYYWLRIADKAVMPRYTFRVVAYTGAIKWVEINATIVQWQGEMATLNFLTDITESKRAEDDIMRQSGLITSLLDSIPDFIFYKDINGVYQGCNPSFAEFVGRDKTEIVGKTDYDLFDVEIAESFREQDKRMLELFESRHNEEWITYPDGRRELLDTLKTPYLGPDGKLLGVLGISRDITERKQSELKIIDSERRYRLLWESASEGFCLHEMVFDDEGTGINYRILDVNPVYESITGLKAEDVIGKLATEAYNTSEPPYLKIYARVASSGISEHFEAIFPEMGKFFSISVYVPSPGQFATAFSDISERKSHEELMAFQATHDTLTGLLNRQYFEQYLSRLIQDCENKQTGSFVVLFLDLDQFKLINDTLGHKSGDLMLIKAAERLQSCLRAEDILTRIGGDEFTMILSRNQSRSVVQIIASRIIDCIAKPFEIQDHEINIGISIGISSYPEDGADTVTLLKHADTAMYRAKRAGRGTFKWYSEDIDSDT